MSQWPSVSIISSRRPRRNVSTSNALGGTPKCARNEREKSELEENPTASAMSVSDAEDRCDISWTARSRRMRLTNAFSGSPTSARKIR